MDFNLTAEQEALKKQFDVYFSTRAKEAPPAWTGAIEDMFCSDEGWQYHLDTSKQLGEKGWLSLPWPKKYGGQEHGIIEQFLFNEAKGYHRVPGGDPFGVNLLAPTLLVAATDEQKSKYLPPIARGEVTWSQGWSEPNAGSDLASLTTKAVLDGDHYIINGQKIWTSGAHRADWCFAVVRTDPSQKRGKGLSFILIDMKTPGITIRPLENMARQHMFNEVFFDDVRVPVENRVGPENEGWRVTRTMMNFERSSVGIFAESKRSLEDLIDYCKNTERGGKQLADDPLIRHKLAEKAIEINVGYAMSRSVAWLQQKGEYAVAESSAVKTWGTELFQSLTSVGCEIMGLYGQLEGSNRAPVEGRFAVEYQNCTGLTILGGTSEIQRNLVAWEALGLPRT